LIERLRPTLSEWERGNFAAGAEILSPDVLLSGLVADGMVDSRGFEEMAEFLRDFFGQWANYRIEVNQLTPVDDSHVVMEGRQHGVGKHSGIQISESLYIVFCFQDDRVTEMYWHMDRAEALKAAGLPA
jgi:SnoaL-like domain